MLSLSQQSSTVGGLWILTMLRRRRPESTTVNIYSLFEIQNVNNINMCHAPGDQQV